MIESPRRIHHLGGALQARMLLALKERGVALRAETALRQLIVEEGRVTGVRVQHGEEERRIEARHGVVLNAGAQAGLHSMDDGEPG